jgi:GTP-binding protein
VEELEAEAKTPAIRVAIIGRPNSGKSTLLNTLCGSERSIVSPIAGTTRDAVDESVTRNGVTYTFVDTAGIRRKGKTKLMAEKLSVVMARKHIRMAHVVLFLVDATEGVVNLDANIAGYAIEDGRPVIICVNKWDAVQDETKKDFTQKVRDEFKFLDYAPVIFLSAKTGGGVHKLFPLIHQCFDSAAKRVGTGELNRFVELIKHETDVKILYMTQASVRPPTFVCFTDQTKLHFSTERFLINQLRKRFGFEGTPIFLKSKFRHARRD